MVGNSLSQARRRVGLGLMASLVGGLVWASTPGLPIWWAPRASAEVKAAGLELFEHEWTAHDPIAGGDGLGPVFNGRSCVACHFQGGVGGGGANQHNVVSFELLPTSERPTLKGGLIHAFAIENKYTEKLGTLREMFPIVEGCIRAEGQCKTIFFKDFDPLRTESVNSPALFGVGWVDRLSGKTIHQLGMRKSIAKFAREITGEFDGIIPGRPRVLADGRIGKFGWKAQFASLEDFVAAACANEMGLGNPVLEQAKPIGHDYPDVPPDINPKQFANLVGFVDTLPRPEAILPESAADRDQAQHGAALFNKVGCASCHTPDIGGLSAVYSDFLLHRLDDRTNGVGSGYQVTETIEVPLADAFPLPEEWKTPPLWGVADSAPYLHDGSARTLETAIDKHRGDAEVVFHAYKALPASDRQALIAFLKTLRAPRDIKPATLATNP